jgi:hypothetical protein
MHKARVSFGFGALLKRLKSRRYGSGNKFSNVIVTIALSEFIINLTPLQPSLVILHHNRYDIWRLSTGWYTALIAIRVVGYTKGSYPGRFETLWAYHLPASYTY